MEEYANGCAISFNPDEVISMLDSVIKETFIAGGDSGGTGSAISSIFSFGNAVQGIDLERRKK